MKQIEIINLNGIWNLKNEPKSININAQVPGTVFETLIENGIIEDPFYGIREREMSWIYESDWQYETEFIISPEFLEHANIILRFHGLDTITNIYLNDEFLGTTNNMFFKYDFNVKSKIKKEKNKIKIIFKSPTAKAREEIINHDLNLVKAPESILGISTLRKAQYSFGWDWGPKLPDMGIWQPVELLGFDDIKINSVYTQQTFIYNKDPLKIVNPSDISSIEINVVNLTINVELDSKVTDVASFGYSVNIKLKDPNGTILTKKTPLSSINQSIEININNPQIWWTHDLGTPNLYEMTVSILNEEIIDTLIQKIGLRDLQLIRKPDEWGETFYFNLNGVPIFAKGANWIPIDSFIPRGKKKGLYEMNLKYAKEANMNMIRVWGGGIYEDDLFYDLCDELGVLVWQDFPFACHLYPSHEKFIENVKNEAIQNIKRLRHHPSLSLWCGNNEIEQLWKMLLIQSNIRDPNTINDLKSSYINLFEKILPTLIKEYDPNRPYWPSSPSNGKIGEKLGSIDSNSPNRGDSHFWSVWHGGKPISAFRKFNSRFMSEYGFESFPSIKTIRMFCPPDQYDFNSLIMENHQKNAAGNKKIMRYMKKRFSIPIKFEQQVILSQITQAEAIEYGVEHWRRNRNNLRCMGSLYWQLNDCWAVASWSSIDYYGRWKALHYVAKRFYRSFFASVREEKDNVEFWLTNDLRFSREGTLKWKILNSQGKILLSDSQSVRVSPCNSLLVRKVDVSDINKNRNEMKNNVIFFSLEAGEFVYNGFRLFVHPKDFPLKGPELSFTIKEHDISKDSYIIKINTKNIALYVHIESDLVDFIASDNYFSMEPRESRTITLKIVKIIDFEKKNIEKILDSFKVNSLHDLK
ncbi:MAG: beta-mannosidase [Promethearchaeota archaeon]